MSKSGFTMAGLPDSQRLHPSGCPGGFCSFDAGLGLFDAGLGSFDAGLGSFGAGGGFMVDKVQGVRRSAPGNTQPSGPRKSLALVWDVSPGPPKNFPYTYLST